MKRLLYGLLAFFVLFFVFPGYDAQAAEESTEMSVKLKNDLGNVSSITVTAVGVYMTSEGTPFMEDGEKRIIKAESGKLGVYLNGEKEGTYSSLTVIPKKNENLLSINGRPYTGSMEFTVEGKYVRPINHVPIEDYLKGVVPSEMPASWHIEALKAQAIAARTYALCNQSKVIDDTVSYQVYRGAESHSHSNLAVDETKGLVLKYDGKLIDALFSSSNGGVTELDSNVWSSETPLPYLDIKEDPFDSKTKWSLVLDKQQIDLSKKDLTKPDQWWTGMKEKDEKVIQHLKNWLQSNGYAKKDIKITDIPVLKLTDSTSGGRVSKGSIELHFYVKDLVDQKGKLVQQRLKLTNVAASKIRSMVGTNKMMSYLVIKSAPDSSDRIEFEGLGFGHGVGMSQYGAKNRAEAGHGYQEILAFYYPRTVLVKEYEGIATEPVAVPVVNKDTTAPKITKVHVSGNYSTEKASIAFTLSEAAKVTIEIKNAKGKVIAKPVNGKSLKKGKQAVFWNFKDTNNGMYSVLISAKDVSRNQGSAKTTITVKKTNGKVMASILNIRETPSTSSNVIGQLKKNQTVTILDQQGNWYKIKSGKKIGYVSKNYIKK